MTQHQEAPKSEASNSPTRSAAFSVIAGKYDGNEPNCKYSEDFATLDEAIAAYDSASDYHWCYLEYNGRVMEICRRGWHPLR